MDTELIKPPLKGEQGFISINKDMGFILAGISSQTQYDLDLSVKSVLKNFSTAIPQQPYLVGQIDNEYILPPPPSLSNEIMGILDKFKTNPFQSHFDSYNKKSLELNHSLYLDPKVWVNFQKKYEYNPIHNHSGILSFVIWHKIPFTRQNEITYGPGKQKSTTNLNGCFQFNFPYAIGGIGSFTLPIDKEWNGTIAIFPSDLVHQVYPFYTSDDYRITISGNLYLKKIYEYK